MKKRIFFILMIATACIATIKAQTLFSDRAHSVVGLKTNLPYWGLLTPNLGVEFRVATKWSIEFEAGLNPYDEKIKHFRLHPEVRYWFCEVPNGHFIGLHTPYLIYNVSDVKWLKSEAERNQGWGAGVGLSYGYSWLLAKHWNLEATAGFGYLYLKSDRYNCGDCGSKLDTVKKHYFGLTQAAINLVYIF